MNFDLDEGIAVLERTPGALRALLAGLPDGWMSADEGPDTFTPLDNVGISFTASARTGGAVTLRQLLATWVTHDLGHLAQVSRVMAKRYRDDVGPWRAFLPVLDR